MNWIRDNRWLVLILAAAFAARFVGLDYGLPYRFIADEFLMVAVSLKMLDEGAIFPYFPGIFYHQPLTAYISALGIGAYLAFQLAIGTFADITAMKQHYLLNAAELLIVPRFLSVLFGVGSVYLLYLIGKKLFGERAGLIAAFFGAFEFLSVSVYHTARVWGFFEFFILLAIYFGVQVLSRQEIRSYVCAGFASAAAIFTLLPGIFTAMPVIASRFMNWRQDPRGGFFDKKLIIFICVVLIGLILSVAMNPRGLGALLLRFDINIPALSETVFDQSRNPGTHPIRESVPERIINPALTLVNYIPVYFALFILGILYLWREDKSKFWLIISFVIPYYLFIGPFFAYGKIARTLLPLAAWCLLVAAFVVDRWLESPIFKKKFLGILLIFAISAHSVIMSVLYDVKSLREDTREQAINWVYGHLLADSRIMMYSVSYEVADQNQEVLRKIAEVMPDRLDMRQKAMLAATDIDLPHPKYFAWPLHAMDAAAAPPDFFKNNKFKYYLRARWGNEPEGYFEKIIEDKLSVKKMIVSFRPMTANELPYGNFGQNVADPLPALWYSDRFGPIVEIYEVEFK